MASFISNDLNVGGGLSPLNEGNPTKCNVQVNFKPTKAKSTPDDAKEERKQILERFELLLSLKEKKALATHPFSTKREELATSLSAPDIIQQRLNEEAIRQSQTYRRPEEIATYMEGRYNFMYNGQSVVFPRYIMHQIMDAVELHESDEEDWMV